jgi:glycosyltransferase involved in cell wall biosynthesis
LNRDLNIVTLNIPYPPDYGGMIDSFYRIKSLHDLGTDIHLHCFEYERGRSTELSSICKSVTYYPRQTGLLRQFSYLPFVVISRRSKNLLSNLLKNNYPVLFDGLHTTYYLNHPALADRRKFVRLHNIEHKYYNDLARYESDIFKKFYFLIESLRLKNYEKVLFNATRILPISIPEHDYFRDKYRNSAYFGPFHPFLLPEIKTGSGDYILYHGDLSINANAVISEELISNVFSRIDYRCIIAGKNPPERLRALISNHHNISLISNPDNEEIISLISNAQINLLPSLNDNGLKIKLLFALFSGRHCLVNSVMSGRIWPDELFSISDTWEGMVEMIPALMLSPFTGEMVEKRRRILSEKFNNNTNALELISLIFGS